MSPAAASRLTRPKLLRGVACLMTTLAVTLSLAGDAAAQKTKRTIYTDDRLAKAKRKIASEPWAKKRVADYEKAAQFYLKMSDEELWNYIPPADQYRALNVHFGSDCPVHGAEIHRKGGHYPWIMTRDKPFKVQCPVGKEFYPSNDFKPWWTEPVKGRVTPENSSPKEKYVDEGAGWVDEKGERYWFVAHYMFWQRWRRDVLPGIDNLAHAYLLTGKPEYGHKAAVMLARLAQEYPQMDYLKQAYHHAYPTKVRGKILDYIWETSTVYTLANAYDAAFPATDLARDAELAAFLKGKGVADLRASVEKNILTVMIDALMSNQIRGNMGMPQRAMAGLALVLDNDDPAKGHTTRALVDWILKTEPGETTGETDALFYNGFYRDGHGGEASPGYSAGWNNAFYTVAKDLDRIGVNLFERPKMKKMADILLDMTMAGSFSPSIGDNGSVKGASRLWSAHVFKEAWLRYRDPRYAQALKLMKFKDENLWEDSIEGEIAAATKGMGSELILPSRNLGGYGLAVLEAGRGKNRRAVSMYYGSAAGGHGQRDRLTTEAWFFGKPVMSEHGYPAHWLPKNPFWTGNTVSHYAVVVDKKWQQNLNRGRLHLFADGPSARVMEASAEGAYPGDVSLYRHTTAMIDMGPDRSYLFDVWRVRGGSQHDWSFHGFAFADFAAPEVPWSPVRKEGTLAGPGVKFAATDAPDPQSGFQYLFNVQQGAPTGTFTSVWKSSQDDQTALRMTLLDPPATVFAADCEPELQPGAPETMKYLIARNTGSSKDLSSTFAAVVEPVKGENRVQKVQSLAPTKAAPGFAGARVEYRDEKGAAKTDYVLSGLDAETTATLPGGVEFAGQFGVASADGLFLVNGTRLRLGALSVAAQAIPAKIAAVDAAKNEVTLDAAFPAPGALVGTVVTIGNALHSTSYTVQSAANRNGKTVLGFGDTLPVVGEARATAVDAAKNTVTTDTILTGHARVDNGQHQGRYLTDAKRTFTRRIQAFDGKTFTLEGGAPPLPAGAALAAGSRFLIVDFDAGDAVHVPSIQSVRRDTAAAAGQYRVRSTVPLTVSLPAPSATATAQVKAGRAWKPLTGAVTGGALTLRLDPATFEKGEAVIRVRE